MNKLLSYVLLIFFVISCKEHTLDYDEIQAESLNDKITWAKQSRLRWTDFIYDESKEYIIYAKLGIGSRYNIDQPIRFDSFTSFSLSESYVSDTTDINSLRIAQAKYDLLETYRRQLEIEMINYRESGVKLLDKRDFDKKIEDTYRKFQEEWYRLKPIITSELDSIDLEIQTRLK